MGPLAVARRSGKGAAPGWGKLSTPLPTVGLAQGQAGFDHTSRRSRKCQPRRVVRPFSRDHRSVSLLSDLRALRMDFRGPARREARSTGPFTWHSGMERRVAICVPYRALRRDAG
jgi:hypothetical protein